MESAFKKVKIIASASVVPFQNVPLPYTPEWPDQLAEFEKVMKDDSSVVMVPLRDPEQDPSVENLAHVGVEVKVMRVIDLPDGQKTVFLLAGSRMLVHAKTNLSESRFEGEAALETDYIANDDVDLFEQTMQLVLDSYEYVKSFFSEVSRVSVGLPKEIIDDHRAYLNFIITTSPLDYKTRLHLLHDDELIARAGATLIALEKIRQQIELRKEIFAKASADMEREQRDQFLRNQIRQIQNEIGEGNDDADALEERATRMDWPEHAAAAFSKELIKLRRYPSNSPDYAIQYTYLDTLLSLPWNKLSEDNIEISKLQDDLDKDHYGLQKIKQRIIEHMAVLKLRGDMKSPILCLYGPPGVGKTSLCKSIADSIGRSYARVSLGGLHDETQIRGHRRTYVGALPGRIIAALQKLDTNNPVFVLDEIDKIGNDHRGDPAQALLELLDPEQNSRFHDNYLDVDYDMSKVFFIATANSLSGISAPLLDRMELIEVTGYLPEEKLEIAKRHLIPKQLENHGFKRNEVKISDDAVMAIIESYTRESGVRKLEKTIAALLRKIAVLKAKGEKYPKRIDKAKAVGMLGKEDILPEMYEGNLPVGVTAGLAWTAAGGEILYFESALSKGKGALTLTGNLGDVMKESATIAMQWVKSNAGELGIDPDRFASTDVHLHVPEGAVPKDGPSAGITMICSLAGSFTGRRSRDGVAMTGEATLSGKVLPVGGIREKILAAKRAGFTDIILSEKNRRDIDEIEKAYVDGVTFHYVKNVMEVIGKALV